MEITFELVRWEAEELADLTDALNAAGIAHRLEGVQLTVEEYDADRTDAIIEEISNPSGGGGDDGDDADDDEVGYQLEGWTDDQLDQLERSLASRQLSYSWDDDGTLVVPASDEHTVDALIAEVEGTMEEALRELAAPVQEVLRDQAILETPAFIDPATMVLAGHPSPEVRRLLQDLLFRADSVPSSEVREWARQLAGLLPGPPTVAGMPDVADDEHDELVYELVDWSDGMRAELVLLLERDGVPYEWDGNDLAVPAAYEAQVDVLMDQMEQGDELPAAAPAADDEANYQRLSELFDAADRVAHDPSDVSHCAELVGAVDIVASLPAFYGIDDLTWRAILEQGTLAVQAIDGQQDDRVVAQRATKLRDALRGFV